ncbi:MAG TPA: type II toxin-antitoxin system RelE/ParE family toxin [Acidobacteriaceae bacterium]|nr:type II toxin-antitoxin system RelE/ParE family toxin [Acidobacteriaceae bacterium]
MTAAIQRKVRITLAAWRDIEEIVDWIADHDALEKARHVLERILNAAEKIAQRPHGGTRPKELPADLGGEIRQVYFKPYRIVYRVSDEEIVIHLVVDGRRSLQSLLWRRLTNR